MDDIFITHTYRKRTIRYRWDETNGKYWFVCNDVISALCAGDKKAWAIWKEMTPTLIRSSFFSEMSYYSLNGKQKTITVLDKRNIKAIRSHISYTDQREFIEWLNNPIPQSIIDLTALALSDRVLTPLERETIIEAGIKEGVPKKHIIEYIENEYRERLKSYTKEELRDCPFCGAQIPLVSDDCLFCGKPLEHIVKPIKVNLNLEGTAADIIRSQNIQHEEERHGIKTCPDCGAPFPLISNICSSCGFVLHEKRDNHLNIKNLLMKIQSSINRLDNTRARALQVMDYWLYYLILLISGFGFITSILFDNEVGKTISLIGFCIGIAFVLFGEAQFLNNIRTPFQKSDNEYYNAKYSLEMYARQVKTLYGNNQEAKQLLRRFNEIINQHKENRRQHRKKVLLITAISSLVICALTIRFMVFNNDQTQQKQLPNLPIIETKITGLSKLLSPDPRTQGMDARINDYLNAPDSATLSFVITEYKHPKPSYRWKINKLRLKGTGAPDSEHSYVGYSIGIVLLNKNYIPIKTLGGSIVNSLQYCDYHSIMGKGYGEYYADFWSSNSTESELELENIFNQAVYYKIISAKP